MSDEENDVINDREHDALLRNLRQLDKPNKNKNVAVAKPIKKKVAFDKAAVLDDLVGAISSTKNVSEIKSHLDSANDTRKRKRKTLEKPLHRQARERVESAFAYKESRKELRTWDPIVHENRAAEQLFFPLNDANTFYGITTTEKAKSFTPRTELEKKLCEEWGMNKPTEEDADVDEELKKAMDLKETKKRKLKLQKMRAIASYTASKNARQSKIKSKTFHRVRKREQRKKLIKEIEDLLAKDPEAAKEKLKELDKDRAYERATLKHRGTGKWSVQLRKYASQNSGMQKLITEHLSLGRELKKRHGLENALDPDSNDEEEKSAEKPLTKAEMLELAVDQARRELEKEEDLSKVMIKKASENPELLENLRFIRQKDEEKDIATVKLADVEVLPVNSGDEEDEGDGFLTQAFNADDVVGEFVSEKERLEKEAAPKVIDNRLFGWGSWTGPGISDEKQMRNKERFISKTKAQVRKDKGKKGLIIREELADQNLAKLQPKDVPFPFTAVKDFEAVIRQPIGKEWNTHMAHKSLIRKSINTKTGRIIRPMDKNEELRKTTEEIFGVDDDELL